MSLACDIFFVGPHSLLFQASTSQAPLPKTSIISIALYKTSFGSRASSSPLPSSFSCLAKIRSSLTLTEKFAPRCISVACNLTQIAVSSRLTSVAIAPSGLKLVTLRLLSAISQLMAKSRRCRALPIGKALDGFRRYRRPSSTMRNSASVRTTS